uniref:WAP domain-containing protein n=1 Tax=Leptobrachium leishanense TaxID=445787 RepID=A0A8C5MI08_9ANUR
MAGTRNIFCLLILIVFCTGKALSEVKPGLCPPVRCTTCKPHTDCAKWCNEDTDCLGDEKCCPEGKAKVCKPPKKVRPGVCPPVLKPPKKSCDDECTSDSECAPDYKCCFSEDGKFKCVPPVGVPEGFCPAPIAASPTICLVICKRCPRGEKCCPWKCLKQCVPTVTVKPGQCPFNEIHCIQGSHTLCTSDGGCPGTEKCCGYMCGKECLSPVHSLTNPAE